MSNSSEVSSKQRSVQESEETPDTSEHSQHYSEIGFWDKIKKFATNIGSKGIYFALILYYVMIDEETPMNQKGIILGALGYLISPLDLVPDLVPIIGFSDDIAAMTAALKMIWASVRQVHLQRAEEQTKQWFSDFEAPTLSL